MSTRARHQPWWVTTATPKETHQRVVNWWAQWVSDTWDRVCFDKVYGEWLDSLPKAHRGAVVVSTTVNCVAEG